MDFTDKLNSFISRIDSVKSKCLTEEATKHSLVLPFIDLLGYDVFNPLEVVPEFIADIGIKKGEKVDYLIKAKDRPAILIEAKHYNQKLDVHFTQLFRYFTVTEAKFAILTNGIRYQFFTDLVDPNKMDEKPFLDIDLQNLLTNQIEELKKFQKEKFDPEAISNSAVALKYITAYKDALQSEFTNPSLEFTKYFARKIHLSKVLTEKVLKEFAEIIKKGNTEFITETLNEKLQTALKNNNAENSGEIKTQQESFEISNSETPSRIITTDEELEVFYIIRSILSQVIDPERVQYIDTLSYFKIYLDKKMNWIVIFKSNSKSKELQLNNLGTSTYLNFTSVNEIYKHKELILALVKENK